MKNKSIPIQFILLTLITVLPILAGTLLYFKHDLFTFKTLNKGMLVNPVIDAKNLDLNIPNTKKWRIVYIKSKDCDKACQTLSYQLSQMTKILNKDRDRTVAVAIDSSSKKLKEKFIQQGDKDFIVENKIYLIDPIGNLFMYYPATMDPMNILKDMKRVLEVSQIG